MTAHQLSVVQDTGQQDALSDDVIRIHVLGLAPRAQITIHSRLEEIGHTFGSTACFNADNDSEVDVSKHPSVRGTYTGKGPFPGVIDMFGGAGTLAEFWAALLASREFAAYALPYFNYNDFPSILEVIDFEYFMEAVDWLVSQSYVRKGGIGIIGVSKGGEIALQIAFYITKIKAVVSINAAAFSSILPMIYKGNYIGIPGRHLVEFCLYPGAEHLIEPQYAPNARSVITNSTVKGFTGVQMVIFGGNPADHARAQEQSRSKILEFFRSKLQKTTITSKL